MSATEKRSRSAVIFPAAVIGVVAMMVVPLPSLVLDLLLSVNIAAGVLILLASMNASRVLDLASFPSILLLATLFRLGLNVSTTRQILGTGSAGSVITSFGQSVVGGSLVVGLVIFFILVIIQFVVITNGSSRVSEVAARFTLDAMPGKQMAIDADLNAGLISDGDARRRRNEIAQEADFFGAMDGASKFVKGDAIAGLIITTVNLIGGLAIGMTSMGLSAGEAMKRFALLTIGDGLVSQIPALLISIAAGIIVTRSSASEHDLGSAVAGEFAKQQRAFQIAGVALAALGALPGLPLLPFAFIGGLLVLVSIRLQVERPTEPLEEEPEVEAEEPDDPQQLIRNARVEPLTLEIANDMIDLVDETQGGDLLDRIKGLRRKVATETGFVMPTIRTRDNAGLDFGSYRILAHGVTIAEGVAPAGRVLVIDDELGRWPGEEILEPVFGLAAKWVPESFKPTIEAAGATVVDRSAVITTHLGEVLVSHSADLFDRQQMNDLIDIVKESQPSIIDDIAAADVPMPTIQWIFRDLLQSQVPIKDSTRILEVISASYPRCQDPEAIVEEVRLALGAAITEANMVSKELHVISMDGLLEQELLAALNTTNGSELLDATTLQTVMNEIVEVSQRAQNNGNHPVLLCSPQLRRPLAALLDRIASAPQVLSFKEVGSHVKMATVGTISLPHRQLEAER
ncbi:MAG: flagellar biosynthesis protein FlhA, partial [Ilumatobacteraceae bacterium]|jgi:flagellar biosynthesis protein FlhA